MHVLGISAFQRDSAAALVRDGELLAVLAEERFSRSPHEAGFPRRAVRACLARAGIEPQELDAVAFAEKPSRCFERLLQEELSRFPRSWRSFPKLQLSWLGERLWARGRLATEIGVPSNRVLFVESQRARAAWARLCSPAERTAILVSDEAREWATTTLARADGGALEVLGEVHAPHGLCRFAAESARALGLAWDR
jgi:carbamoyltransferase